MLGQEMPGLSPNYFHLGKPIWLQYCLCIFWKTHTELQRLLLVTKVSTAVIGNFPRHIPYPCPTVPGPPGPLLLRGPTGWRQHLSWFPLSALEKISQKCAFPQLLVNSTISNVGMKDRRSQTPKDFIDWQVPSFFFQCLFLTSVLPFTERWMTWSL